MIVKLDEKACSLDADELVAFVRLSFNADKDGYVYGSNKELSEKQVIAQNLLCSKQRVHS